MRGSLSVSDQIDVIDTLRSNRTKILRLKQVRLMIYYHKHLIVLTTIFFLASISWAQLPNARVVFQSDRDGDLEIYTMNTDRTDLVQLTHNLASDAGPHWSPDGKQILFISNRDGNLEIYVMDADGMART